MLQAFIPVYLSIISRYLGPVFQFSCISISSSKYKKDTFSLMMPIPFQLRSFSSSCPLWGLLPLQSFSAFVRFSDRIVSASDSCTAHSGPAHDGGAKPEATAAGARLSFGFLVDGRLRSNAV